MSIQDELKLRCKLYPEDELAVTPVSRNVLGFAVKKGYQASALINVLITREKVQALSEYLNVWLESSHSDKEYLALLDSKENERFPQDSHR